MLFATFVDYAAAIMPLLIIFAADIDDAAD